MNKSIRHELPGDGDLISELTRTAFCSEARPKPTEQFNVDALRAAGLLTISMVAIEKGIIIGHVAISPVTLGGAVHDWYGLGPISVYPNRQRQGIGSKLVRAALIELKRHGAQGCVVLGSASCYGRFGFRSIKELTSPDFPGGCFMALSFGATVPTGTVRYHYSIEHDNR